MKTNSILKRGNGFKITNSSLKRSGFNRSNSLKKTSFKTKLSDLQKITKEADSNFSLFIIRRDGKCLNCESNQMLSCSHWEGRSNFSTRYDPSNCITLCIPCHQNWESKKKTIYKEFMYQWLGSIRYKFLLERIALKKVNKEEIVLKAQALLKKVGINSDIQY